LATFQVMLSARAVVLPPLVTDTEPFWLMLPLVLTELPRKLSPSRVFSL